jgi:beta-lactamase regulating signal transducer with metallopeptidase domain
MGDLFYKILEMSIYGSIAFLAVLLFRLVFKKCPKRVLIIFWLVVALRLILPFNFNSPTSALNIGKLFTSKTTVSETVKYDPETRIREATTVDRSVGQTAQSPAPAGADNAAPADSQAEEAMQDQTENKASKVSLKTIIPIVWLSVAGAMLIFSAVRYAMFYSKARWSSRSFDGRYYMANNIDSPFVVGVIKPKIFFPINMDDDEREYVLNHEWTHIKNKDGLTKLLSYIILCFHWFNPFVWIAFFMLCADIEMRVDEETTSNFNLAMVKEYCKSLVRHAADDNNKGGAFMQSTAFSGLGFGGMETKLRVTNLLKSKVTSRAIQITSIVVTMIFTVLVSASSVDHERKTYEKVSDPEPEVTVTESAAVIESTEESGLWSDDYIGAYCTFIYNFEHEHPGSSYSLIYINKDLIPELVVDNPDCGREYASEVSVYSFRNGEIVPVFEGCIYDAIGSEAYGYVPYGDFLCHMIVNSEDSLEFYGYSMSDLMAGNEPSVTLTYEYKNYYLDGEIVDYDTASAAMHEREMKTIYGEQTADEVISTLNGTGSQTSTVATTTSESTTESETSESTSETTVETAPKWMPVSQMQDETVFEFSGETFRKPKLDCTYGSFIIEAPADDRLRITYNDKAYDLSVKSARLELYVCDAYLFKHSGQVYIYVGTSRDSIYDINVYKVTDDSVSYVGTAEYMSMRIFYGTDKILCYEMNRSNDFPHTSRYYKVGSDGMPYTDDTIVKLEWYGALRAKKEMTGFIVRDGSVTQETKTIYAGDKVEVIYIDESDHIDFRDADNEIIRYYIIVDRNNYYDPGNPVWVVDLLKTLLENP